MKPTFFQVSGRGTELAVGFGCPESMRGVGRVTPSGAPPREWEPPSSRRRTKWPIGTLRGSRDMKKARRNRQHAKFPRLRRHLDIALDPLRPRRIRTRSARYAA